MGSFTVLGSRKRLPTRLDGRARLVSQTSLAELLAALLPPKNKTKSLTRDSVSTVPCAFKASVPEADAARMA